MGEIQYRNIRGIRNIIINDKGRFRGRAVKYTVKYVTICSFGIPFIVGYNGVSGVFRGFGDSRTPLYFVALACAINIGLDLLLIAVIPMGVAGAAVDV